MKTFDLKDFKSRGGQVHFIGCAGAGTQPLASIFLDLGFPCSGSDLLETERTEQLQARGMKVYRGHAAENLPPEGTADSAESKKRRRRELPAFIFLHKKPKYAEIKTRQNLQKSRDRHRVWQNLTYIPQYGIKKLDQKSYGPY